MLSTKEAGKICNLTSSQVRQYAYHTKLLPYQLFAGRLVFKRKHVEALAGWLRKKRVPISERLKKVREKLGLSRQDIARLLVVSRFAVYRWEAENRYPRAEILQRLEELEKKAGCS